MSKKEPKISIIISVAIAIVLWLYVMGEVDPNTNQRFNNIPVTFENIDALEEKNLVFDYEKDYFIDVLVYGRTSAMYGLRDKIEARVDLSNINQKGTYKLRVKISGIPDSLELRKVYNEEITLEIDRITDNVKNVSIDIIGEPEKGLSILYTEIYPEKVKLTGPEEILSEVDKVVGKINIANAKSDVIEKVELTPVDEYGKIIEGAKLDTNTAEVSVHIGEKKTIPIEVTVVNELEDDFFIKDIRVSPKTITVGAKGSVLKNIDKIETEEIIVDASREKIVKEVSLKLPDKVMILNEENKKVTVTINIEKNQKRTFKISNINKLNISENMEVVLIEDSPVTVILEGRQKVLEKLKAEDIKLYIDLEDYGLGNHRIPIKIEPINDTTLVELNPKDILVEIREKSLEEETSDIP